MEIKIGNHTIGTNHPTYFIADIAANHDGHLDRAKMLIRLAKERGIKGFTADILASNKAMLKVLEKGELPVQTKLDHGAFEITIPFE